MHLILVVSQVMQFLCNRLPAFEHITLGWLIELMDLDLFECRHKRVLCLMGAQQPQCLFSELPEGDSHKHSKHISDRLRINSSRESLCASTMAVDVQEGCGCRGQGWSILERNGCG